MYLCMSAIFLSFCRFGIHSSLAINSKRRHSAWRHRAFFGFHARHGLIYYSSSVYCTFFDQSPGESQSISEADNSGLQTQQYPIWQVLGNPCRGRFNTGRTATWTSARAAKKPRKWCETALKFSFKLFFLKCIFEFMINTVPQGSNSLNGREKYFKGISLHFTPHIAQWPHGLVVWGLTFCAGGRWGAGSKIQARQLAVFFFFSSRKYGQGTGSPNAVVS